MNNAAGKKSKKLVKVPVVMQMENTECGAACLSMILEYYGKFLPLALLREECGVSRDGVRAVSILQAAREYGLEASGLKAESWALKIGVVPFPCIIHWNNNHFVVLDGFRGTQAVINDPARGVRTVSGEEFDKSYTGTALSFHPGDNFTPSGEKTSTLRMALGRMVDSRSALVFVLILALISTLLGVINPTFVRVFLDRLLSGQNTEWARTFFILFSLVKILQIVVNFVKGEFSLQVSAKADAVGNSTFLWKLLHLPVGFYSQRSAGDLFSRKNTNSSITSTLVFTLGPFLVDFAEMFFYLIVMLRYSVPLSLIGIGSAAVNLLINRLIIEKKMNIARVNRRDAAALENETVSGIDMIESIKAGGSENRFFEHWAGYQANVNEGNQEVNRLNCGVGILPLFISAISKIAVFLTGIYLTMRGEFTIGMLMAFQTLLSSFQSPATDLLDAGETIEVMRADLERTDDVLRYPDDQIVARQRAQKQSRNEKLSGEIELSHVSFGYSKYGDKNVSDFSLKIRKGSCVAIVGQTGCGKSTLAKLMTGLYQPWEGEIRYDGRAVSEIDRSVFTASIASVDQEIVLFEDTVSNNIKMWDSSIEDFEVVLAAKDAQIHDDILNRPGGYDSVIRENGKDFSGGQRQRLEIARALAGEPTILIMDEATSALDADTEEKVIKAIHERGITCVVIAHRQSAVRDCDCIVVLDHGAVAECGTHEELLAQNGLYAKLVINE